MRRAVLPVVITAVALVAGWQLVIWVRGIPPYLLPGPAATVGAMGANAAELLGAVLATAEGALVGLAVATVFALALALLGVRWPTLTAPLTSLALVVRTIPIVAVAPVITLLAGRGLATSALCVAIVTTFTLHLAATGALAAAPPALDDLAELYQAGHLRRARRLQLPAAWAGLVAGYRIAVPFAVGAAILAEWLSGRPGLGSLLVQAQAVRDIKLVWAATVCAALLGMLAYALPGAVAAVLARRGLSADIGEALR